MSLSIIIIIIIIAKHMLQNPTNTVAVALI